MLGEERQLAIDRFNSDPERFLFLCTTRAGGLGINLTAASVVIHLDSDFNPQHDLQAQARCHRIGQEKSVEVFHFIAEHTYEDYMLFTIAGKKLGLEAVLLGRLDATKGKAKLDKQQEEKVLRKGVFAAIRDDEAAGREARDFANSSIEEILSAKATTVVLQGGDASTPPEMDEEDDLADCNKEERPPEKISTQTTHALFSTAKFAVSGNRKTGLEGLDEDEPDFWVKVAQRLGPWVLEEEKPQELTRADRRRGRNVNYRSGFYDYDFYVNDGQRQPRVSKNSASGEGVRREDSDDGEIRRSDEVGDDEDDAAFTPLSESEGNSDSEDNDGLVKEDVEVEEKGKLPGISTKYARKIKSGTSEEGDGKKRASLKEQMNWSDWTDFQPLAGPQTPSNVISSSTPASCSLGVTAVGPHGCLPVLDLLYRCLR